MGKRPIATITPADLLLALRRIEARGTHETAHRTRSLCGRIWRFAVATQRADRDITADLKDALTPVAVQNHAAITDPKGIGALLCAIDGYVGQPATIAALKLAPLVFVRPGELRAAQWSEFDLDRAEWRIPAYRMKMGEQHLVPLSRQAVAILRELQPLTGDGNISSLDTRCSAAHVREHHQRGAAPPRLHNDEMTGHGFRALASTRLNEKGLTPT